MTGVHGEGVSKDIRVPIRYYYRTMDRIEEAVGTGDRNIVQKRRERHEAARRRLRKALHEYLCTQVLICLPSDFEPWGQRVRNSGGDCCTCVWRLSVGGELLSGDWLVCLNPESARVGKLTWEHQGCPHYEWEGVE